MSNPHRNAALTAFIVLVGCGGSTDGTVKSGTTEEETLTSRPPLLTINLPTGGAVVTEGSSVTLTATVVDLDTPMEEISGTWASSSGAELCGLAAPSAEGNLTCTFTVSREHPPIVLSVTDGLSTSTAELDLVVRTADPPTIQFEDPQDGGYVNDGEQLTVLAHVEDDNDAPNSLDLVLASDIDGTLFQGAADPSGDIHILVNALSLGDHTLTLSATDRDGFTGTTSIAFEVNSKPGQPTVHIEPSNPGTGDDLQVVIDADAPDADGDTLTYRYTWYKNGTVVAGATSRTVSASLTARDDMWTVDVQAADGRAIGEAASESVEIGNTAPTLGNTALTPDPATASDDLVCVPSGAADADGDTISYIYTWQVSGVVQTETSDTLAAGTATKGNSVVCTASPTDGTATGSAVRSNTVVISNAPPSAPEVSMSPTLAVALSDDLQCMVDVESDDTDGDPVTYTVTWTGDGTSYPSGFAGTSGPATTSYTNDTLPAADNNLADHWVCTVTPTDGTSSGLAASADGTAASVVDLGSGAFATGSTATLTATDLIAQPISLTVSATIVGFGMDVSSTSGSTGATYGLYTDNAGAPGTLLATSESGALGTGPQETYLSRFTSLSAGDYWIVVNMAASGDTFVVADSVGAVDTYTTSDGGVDSVPSTWTGGTSAVSALHAWWLVGF